jgi:hypothetical protein
MCTVGSWRFLLALRIYLFSYYISPDNSAKAKNNRTINFNTDLKATTPNPLLRGRRGL